LRVSTTCLPILSLSIRLLDASNHPLECKKGNYGSNSVRSTNSLPSALLFPTTVTHSSTIIKAVAYISTMRPHLDPHLMRLVVDGLFSRRILLVLSHLCLIGMPSSAPRTRSRHGSGLEMIHLFLQMSAFAIITPEDCFKHLSSAVTFSTEYLITPTPSRLTPVNGELQTYDLSIINVTSLDISSKRKLLST
jgi:hypothetical protein